MKRIEPYIYIVTAFLVDLFILGYGIVRQVILPNRNRKGNLLSSLFLLFTELAERLIQFKKELTRTPWTYGKKYIRLGMLALTWVLFILSSLEWTGPATSEWTGPATSGRPAPAQETSSSVTPGAAKSETTAFLCATFPQPSATRSSGPIINISFPKSTDICSPPKKWLLLRKLLI